MTNRVKNLILILGILFAQVQFLSETDIIGAKSKDFLRACPPDQLIFGGKSITIFERSRRLTDATESRYRNQGNPVV